MVILLKNLCKRKQICFIGGAVILGYCVYALLGILYHAFFKQCNGNVFVQNLCQEYSAGVEGGPACSDICADTSWFFACPRSLYDEQSSQVLLRKHVHIVFGVSRRDFDALVLTTDASPRSQPPTLQPYFWIKSELYGALGTYLGPRERNYFWELMSRKVESDNRKYLRHLLKNDEFILRSLYDGIRGAPQFDWEFCGPVYKSDDIHENYTQSLASHISKVSKARSEYAQRRHVLLWLEAAKELMGLEQRLGENGDDHRLLTCNLTAHNVFLHRWCFVGQPQGGVSMCLLKLPYLSSVVIPESALSSRLERIDCLVDSDCAYASCSGMCVNGTCRLTWSAYMAGIRSVCAIFDEIYTQHLWSSMSRDRRGKWQLLLEKCLLSSSSSSKDSTVLIGSSDGEVAWEQRLPHIVSYNALAGSLVDFVTEEISIQTVFYHRQFGV